MDKISINTYQNPLLPSNLENIFPPESMVNNNFINGIGNLSSTI